MEYGIFKVMPAKYFDFGNGQRGNILSNLCGRSQHPEHGDLSCYCWNSGCSAKSKDSIGRFARLFDHDSCKVKLSHARMKAGLNDLLFIRSRESTV